MTCFAFMLGRRITSKPWGIHWITLVLNRKCNELFCHRIPQEDSVCSLRCVLGHCLHQAWSVMCITLVSTVFNQLNRCFALLPHSTLTSGKKTFRSGCKSVIPFFWHTGSHCHSETEKINYISIKHKVIQERAIREEPWRVGRYFTDKKLSKLQMCIELLHSFTHGWGKILWMIPREASSTPSTSPAVNSQGSMWVSFMFYEKGEMQPGKKKKTQKSRM